MDEHRKTIAVYDRYVENYAEKHAGRDLYHDAWSDFLEMLKQNASVLELGCGPGNVIRFFLDRRTDLKITGVDLAPRMIAHAQNLNPAADFIVEDVRNLDSLTGPYDGVVVSFCLPYLSFSDLDSFFRDLNRLAGETGLLYLSFMEGEKEHSGFEKTSFSGDDEIYIYYHQRENVEKLIAREEFKIEKFYTKISPDPDGTTSTNLVYIAKR